MTQPRADRLALLQRARLYLCTDGRAGRGDLPEFLDAVLTAGVDVVQLRQKNLEAADELALLEVFRAACQRHGRLLAVNDRADLARISGADILHVGQNDLTPRQARGVLGPEVLIGLSTHTSAQALAAEADPEVDYFCAGPVWATPTKPGRAGVGPGHVRTVTGQRPDTPWFAIGGIAPDQVPEVLAAGARRVVVVRAITAAADPAAATRRIRDLLDA